MSLNVSAAFESSHPSSTPARPPARAVDRRSLGRALNQGLGRTCIRTFGVLLTAGLVGCAGAGEDGSGGDAGAGSEGAFIEEVGDAGAESTSGELAADSGAPESLEVADAIETPDLSAIDADSLSPERRATLGAWAATQMASDAGGADDLGALMRRMDAGAGGAASDAEGSAALGDMSQDRLGHLGLEMKTPYDLMAIDAATGLFSAQVGKAEPDMQNFGLHIVSTYEFANLRGAEPMPLDARATHGDIWIVVFDTAEPLTPLTFLPENLDALGDIGDNDPLSGPDGLTTVYYTLTLANDFSGGRFVGIGKGVLTDETAWTRADLEAIDQD